MQFDLNNPIVRLCAEGINHEGQSKEQASKLYHQAWNEATSAFEQFVAAHYVARVQPDIADKLQWDKIALTMALQTNDERAKAAFPSLYLNIAKGYEDSGHWANARQHYQLALSFADQLKEDGYGKMIRSGIVAGIERVK